MKRPDGALLTPLTIVSLSLAVVILAFVAFTLGMRPYGPAPSSIGGAFSLIDQNGKKVTQADYAGKPLIVFFGYTHCPDVCPTTLSDMSQMLNALGKAEPVQALFVTVDPERDTPVVLKDYLSSFDPRIVGLSGDPAAIAEVERRYRVYAKKVPTKDGDYSMDHTAVVYVMDKQGRFVSALNLSQKPEAAAEEFKRDLSG
jgi:protein SCO1/2